MSKLKKYLEEKRIKKKVEELKLPKLYVVGSNRKGVEKPIERQVIDIEKTGTQMEGNIPIDRHKIDSDVFPREFDIVRGETTAIISGHGTGLGDLWQWSYFASFEKSDADKYYLEELERVNKEYLSKQ